MLRAPERIVLLDCEGMSTHRTAVVRGPLSLASSRPWLRDRSRLLIGFSVGVLLSVLGYSPAFADPAGPTDYRSEVTEIIPITPAIIARVIAGDSFLELEVAPGSEVFISGYAAEPYLWIDAGGQVWENQRSPATYYNIERFGADIPASADPTAEPEWTQIGSGHAWSWHDHRIHRMDRFPPLNSSPGEQVLDAVVPITVNGAAVEIHVISVWMHPPSPVPVILGASLGLLAVGWWLSGRRTGSLTGRRSARRAAGLVAPAAGLALVIGLWQFGSLPASTDPLWTWWILPLVAVFATTSAIFSASGTRSGAGAGMAIAGSQLLVWSFQRRAGLWSAILPTDAPWWLDRAVTAAVFPIAAMSCALGLWMLSTGFIPARPRSQTSVQKRPSDPNE